MVGSVSARVMIRVRVRVRVKCCDVTGGYKGVLYVLLGLGLGLGLGLRVFRHVRDVRVRLWLRVWLMARVSSAPY